MSSDQASQVGQSADGPGARYGVDTATGLVIYGTSHIGPATALFASPSTEKITAPGVVRGPLPHQVDFLMAAQGKTVGLESKTVQDLISSWLSRRLNRQLRTLRSVVDVPVLLLRGMDSFYDMDEYPGLQADLVKWQMIDSKEYGRGPGLLALGPRGDPVPFLLELRAILSGQRNLLTVVAGSDTVEVHGTKRERVLQRAIPGVGPKTAKGLAREVGNLLAVLQASEEQVRGAGGNKRTVDGIKEALI